MTNSELKTRVKLREKEEKKKAKDAEKKVKEEEKKAKGGPVDGKKKKEAEVELDPTQYTENRK